MKKSRIDATKELALAQLIPTRLKELEDQNEVLKKDTAESLMAIPNISKSKQLKDQHQLRSLYLPMNWNIASSILRDITYTASMILIRTLGMVKFL
jgi:hypothetical protein